ncbi:hypothetical protein O5O45_04200 [Hahella aquimaris]|uniref:hypothetical protein n=1 Tax=Hahella sp. HNIBRBA332 TaxID=3015983 RepID=UPI00273C2930|nr:hypothetical protein [Hahella sp. HNIBRBA332]WLQ15131.1 hypothetical protein O5O45_04200 [Hahella sp. HNIBRBA332]
MTKMSNETPRSHVQTDSQQERGNPLKFIIGALATAAALMAINTAITASTIGRPTASSQTLCDQVNARIELAERMQGPNLLLIGGSGVRAGFSAQMLSDELHLNALNFGLQASMGPDLTLSEAKRALKPGDTALLAFEYPQYKHDSWNPIELNYGLGCAAAWFKQKPLPDIVEGLMATDLSRIVDVWRFASKENKQLNTFDSNEHGDRLPESFPAVSDKVKRRLSLYQPVNIGIDAESRGAQAIKAFVEYAKANNIKVFATWPNTIDFPEYRKTSGFKQIKEFYTNLGVQMIGEPQLGLYPTTAFYDTQYHLDYASIKKRTQDFITALKQEHIDFSAAQGG